MFGKNSDKKERFECVSSQKVEGLHVVKVLVDKETGVNYLVYFVPGESGSITALLDSSGKPIVTKPEG